MAQTRIRPRNTEQLEALAKRVWRCIQEERVNHALKALELALSFDLGSRDAFRFRALQAELYLVSRKFTGLSDVIQTLRGLAVSADEHAFIAMIEAQSAVLAGKTQKAVHSLAPVIRRFDVYDERRARAFRIFGLACYRRGHYTWARAFLRRAEAFYRLNRQVPELIYCLNSISLVARSEGNIGLALANLEEAARLLPGKGMNRSRMRLLVNRGICLLKMGRLSEARSLFQMARSMASEVAEPVYVTAICNNLGHVYRLEGNHAVAREFHEQALALARSCNSHRQVCVSLEFLGETCADEGGLVQALTLLNEAHEHTKRLAGHGDVMMEILRRRGEVHVMLGNTKAGADDLERAIQLCGSRGEKRESLLARRAYWFLKAADVQDLSTRMHAILEDLEQLEDRFEYARTVYLILKDGRLDPEGLPWLGDATVAATHYFTALGSKIWKSRLQEVSGPRRRITGLRGGENSLQEHRVASRSPRFAAALDAVRVAARSPLPALIVGETGVGKEVIAQLLHRASPRAAGTLTAINCGALPENLVESELFGYAQGAYTGAAKEKPGLFEAAHNGTVLLDEVGDLPPLAQVKLLRFLDTGEVRRVGELRTRRCDVRVLASTNRDLDVLVRERRFRVDLLFRLAAFRIVVPPLRERAEDILDLACVFLREAAQSGSPPTVSAELEGWMLGYEWPGNVRELRNLCGYLHARSWGRDVIQLSDLPPEHQRALATNAESELSPFERDLIEFERARLVKALKESRGNISVAARLLGMGRNTVSQRMRKFGLQRSAFEV